MASAASGGEHRNEGGGLALFSHTSSRIHLYAEDTRYRNMAGEESSSHEDATHKGRNAHTCTHGIMRKNSRHKPQESFHPRNLSYG